jgi:hypothetical protein
MQGKASNWADAKVDQRRVVNKVGFRFRVWQKYKKEDSMIGTVIVNNAGLRWRKPNGKLFKLVTWEKLAELLSA